MARWFFVLSLAVTPFAAAAAASSGSPNAPAQLAEAVVTLRFAQQADAPQAQEPQVQVQEPQVQEPKAEEPPKSDANGGCKAGRRVIAASYGEGQRMTSSGERFDRHGMTAAHRTLPFGTRLTVTNLKTGKSVVVVVNDRGPYTRRIEIDLSIAAAKAIGMNGTAAVCIE
jgi:rare lipoprotein A